MDDKVTVPAVDRPSADEIRAQVERILSSPSLHRGSRRAALLSFLVEESLAGRADRLKGFTVALAVFGRDETFDSQSDPIVRLEARRLRHELDSYYVDVGSRDPIRITIPKGGYAPHFEWQDRLASKAEPLQVELRPVDAAPADAAPSPGHHFPTRIVSIASVLLAVAVIAAMGLWAKFWREPPLSADGPAIIVLPFEALGNGSEDVTLASGLTYELITDLTRFDHFRVYSAPASFRQTDHPDPQALSRDLNVTYVVKGGLRSDGDAIRVGAQLYDAETGRVVWSETYDRKLSAGDLLQMQGELAASIATVLGEPYGKVSADLTERVAVGGAPSMPSYACVLRAYDYRRNFDEALFQPVLDCLKEAVGRDPGYAAAWAMLGWLQMDAVRFRYVDESGRDKALEEAIASASKGVEIDPDNPLALRALSATLYYAGRFDESMNFQRAALALNPNDPDTLAQLGWRLAARGNFDEGMPYLERAVVRSANPPGWYFHLIAVNEYLEGNYESMLASAEKSAVDGSPLSWSFIAIAHGALGQPEEAKAALARWKSMDPISYEDPAKEYRIHGGAEETVDALMAGLRTAGWSSP